MKLVKKQVSRLLLAAAALCQSVEPTDPMYCPT